MLDRPAFARPPRRAGPSPWRLIGLIGSASAVACTPDIGPSWRIQRQTDLAVRIEIESYGPFSEPLLDPLGRPYHEALPLDTVRATPFVVGPDGPIPTEDLAFHWIACQAGDCSVAVSEADGGLPSCEGRTDADVACLIDTGPTVALPLLPFEVPEDNNVFSLLPDAGIISIGSHVDGPGPDECVRRFRDRTELTDCFLMFRSIAFGPVLTLLQLAEAEGLDIDVGEVPDFFLESPRNRVPAVERFTVLGSSRGPSSQEVEMGSTVAVAPGDEIVIAYDPTPLDREPYQVIDEDGMMFDVEDRLSGQWWITADAPEFDFVPSILQTRWTVGAAESEAHLYFVVRDSSGAEGWGWLTFDVGRG